MKVSKSLLNTLIKECCRGLEYDSDRRRHTFVLARDIQRAYDNCRSAAAAQGIEFEAFDFNRLTSAIKLIPDAGREVSLNYPLTDADLLPGEVVEIATPDGDRRRYLKMQALQYVSLSTRQAYTMPADVVFDRGRELTDAEGCHLADMDTVTLWAPDAMSLHVDSALMPGLARRRVADSLWPLAEMAAALGPSDSGADLLRAACDCGIGSHTLSLIIEAFQA